jgi:hypothetical protein
MSILYEVVENIIYSFFYFAFCPTQNAHVQNATSVLWKYHIVQKVYKISYHTKGLYEKSISRDKFGHMI